MKRGQKKPFIVDSEEEYEISIDENDTDTENDENYEGSKSSHTMNKQKKTHGKATRQGSSTCTKKRSRPMDGEHTVILAKKKKSTHKDNRHNDTPTKRIGSRERIKTNRFGARESGINFNDFFVNLDAQQKEFENSQDPATMDNFHERVDIATIPSSVVIFDDKNSTNSVFDQPNQSNEISKLLSTMADDFKMMEAKFDAQFAVLQKQSARIEALLKYYKMPVGMDVLQSKSIERHEFFETTDQCTIQLKEMGLPVTQIQQLMKIEEKLGDTDFQTHMVIFFVVSFFLLSIFRGINIIFIILFDSSSSCSSMLL